MGNSHSSAGTIIGSFLVGLSFVLFTEGTTLIAVSIATVITIIIGIINLIKNIKKNIIPQKDNKKSNLIIGSIYGVIGSMCGYICTLDDKMFYMAMILLNPLLNWSVEMLRIEN
jgi:hypothetical protein